MEDSDKKADVQKEPEDLTRASIAGTAQDQEVLSYIRKHYPEAPDVQSAFIKFVIHSLEHSKEDSERQAQEIAKLNRTVEELQQALSEMGALQMDQSDDSVDRMRRDA